MEAMIVVGQSGLRARFWRTLTTFAAETESRPYKITTTIIYYSPRGPNRAPTHAGRFIQNQDIRRRHQFDPDTNPPPLSTTDASFDPIPDPDVSNIDQPKIL
jgi:hypothetical protein